MIGRCEFIERINIAFVYNCIDMFGTEEEVNYFTSSNIDIRFLVNSMLLVDDIDEFCKV